MISTAKSIEFLRLMLAHPNDFQPMRIKREDTELFVRFMCVLGQGEMLQRIFVANATDKTDVTRASMKAVAYCRIYNLS